MSQAYEAHAAVNVQESAVAGMPGVTRSALVMAASSHQPPAHTKLPEADNSDSLAPTTALRQPADAASALQQIADQVVQSSTSPSQPFIAAQPSPAPPPPSDSSVMMPIPKAADMREDLSAEAIIPPADSDASTMHSVSHAVYADTAPPSLCAHREAAAAVPVHMLAAPPTPHSGETDTLVSEDALKEAAPAVSTPACIAGTSVQGRAAAHMVKAPMSLSSSEPPKVAAGPHSVGPSADLLLDMSAAANESGPPGSQPSGGPAMPSMPEQLMDDTRVSALDSGHTPPQTQLMKQADATSLFQTAEQAGATAPPSRLPVSPATSGGTGARSLPLPASLPLTAIGQPAVPSAAHQAAATEEAATVTHAASAEHYTSGNAFDYSQHGRAPVQCQHDTAAVQHEHAVGGGEGGGDLLYEHLAAVLATVPALRDRVLTFAPLHSQLQLPGTDQPGRDACRLEKQTWLQVLWLVMS